MNPEVLKIILSLYKEDKITKEECLLMVQEMKIHTLYPITYSPYISTTDWKPEDFYVTSTSNNATDNGV